MFSRTFAFPKTIVRMKDSCLTVVAVDDGNVSVAAVVFDVVVALSSTYCIRDRHLLRSF